MSDNDKDYDDVVAGLDFIAKHVRNRRDLSTVDISECLLALCAVSKLLVEKCRSQDKKFETIVSTMGAVSRERAGAAVVLDEVPVRSSLRNAGDKVE